MRTGFVAITIAPMSKQLAAAFVLNRTMNVKGVPRDTVYRSVTLNGWTSPQKKVATLMHLPWPCTVKVTEECGLELAEGSS